MTTEVRIRHVNDATAVHLCTWPVNDLEALIRTIGSWGVSVDYEGDAVGHAGLSGQFVVADGGAFFEIMIETSA